MAEMSEKLGEILNNPEAMSRIMEIVGGLEWPKEKQEPSIPTIQSDKRMELLYALRPLLREHRRERLDSLTRAMSMAQLLGNMKGGR